MRAGNAGCPVALLSKQKFFKAMSRLMIWLLQTSAIPLVLWTTRTKTQLAPTLTPWWNFMQPLAPDGTEDNAEEIEAQTAPIPISANMATEPMPGQDNARQRSKSLDGTEKNGNPLASLHFDVSKAERNPSVTLLFTSHTSLVSVTRRFGAGNVAGGRRAAGAHQD